MYFPTSIPTLLSFSTTSVPLGPSSHPPPNPRASLPNVGEEGTGEILQIERNSRGDKWIALTGEEVALWNVRPTVAIAKVRRTAQSLRTHGPNKSVVWKPDGTVFAVQTRSNTVFFYSIALIPPPADTVYKVPSSATFGTGPGEGGEMKGVLVEGVGDAGLGVGEGVGCMAATPTHLLVSILNPASIRSIPWPSPPTLPKDQTSIPPPPTPNPQKVIVDIMDRWDFLLFQNVTITYMSYSRSLAVYFLITSDGRAYVAKSRRTPPSGPAARKRRRSSLSATSPRRSHLSNHNQSKQSLDSNGTLLYRPEESETSDSEADRDRDREDDDEEEEEEREGEGRGGQSEALDGLEEKENRWFGRCFYGAEWEDEPSNLEWSVGGTGGEGNTSVDFEDEEEEEERREERNEKWRRSDGKGARVLAVNGKFSIVSLGLEDGSIAHFSLALSSNFTSSPQLPPQALPLLPAVHPLYVASLKDSLNSTSSNFSTGSVSTLSWTSDGYALAVGWKKGWSIWSVFGRLNCWSNDGRTNGIENEEEVELVNIRFQDHFMKGVKGMFWAAGNLELTVLAGATVAPRGKVHDEQLFIIPFAKSAVTGLHSPDNTKHAFLQMDDRVLVYRGADQPDMSVINPESDVWQHIKIPSNYISQNWPIKYSCISSDARMIAVAGKNGLTHYNALTGRWKLFENLSQESAFSVRGGMQWYKDVLVVATDEAGKYAIRLFGRDHPLNTNYILHQEPLHAPVVLLSIFDDSLLVYTLDNTFYHFLLLPSRDGIQLRMCGSIGFEGVVRNPMRVRGMSWLVPKSQQRFGDPADDLNVATVIFLIDGHLVLLRPRRAVDQEVKYDMQILADRIEFYWTHLSGIGTLENSLWGWDGRRIRVWLDALTIEAVKVDEERDAYHSVQESVAIDVDFYPLSLLMDKGIIIGVDSETLIKRSLDFPIFKIMTNTHLFLHHLLRFHLSRHQVKEAVLLASFYQSLIYFSHALEILLHSVLEAETDGKPLHTPSSSVFPSPNGGAARLYEPPGEEQEAVLPYVIDFLDHFDAALEVVVGCARKTEVARWSQLFEVVGRPEDLFEKCMIAGQLKVAASYLLVLHNLESLEQSSKDTVRLLKAAMAAQDWALCKELLRFLYSLDDSGQILEAALEEANAIPAGYVPSRRERPTRAASDAGVDHTYRPVSPRNFPKGSSELQPPQTAERSASPATIPRSTSAPSTVPMQPRQRTTSGLGALMSRVGISANASSQGFGEVFPKGLGRTFSDQNGGDLKDDKGTEDTDEP
ncbi:RIC1-domain-containing protein [Atractiella rhizophila]|nr:RIC1-domain-containing protein [Atractiella rhizophila]